MKDQRSVKGLYKIFKCQLASFPSDPNWLDETSNPVRIPNGSSLNQGYLDSVQQARLGDEQSYKKLLPFLVNSKQTGEIPEDGPSM